MVANAQDVLKMYVAKVHEDLDELNAALERPHDPVRRSYYRGCRDALSVSAQQLTWRVENALKDPSLNEQTREVLKGALR